MKRVLLSIIFIGLTLAAFCQKKETRPVSGFTAIDASSVFDITVTKGNTESLVIEADDEVMPYVRSEVRNNVLHLYLDNGKKVNNVKILKAYVVMRNLEKVTLSGACKLTAKDLFTPDKFKSDCSGASSLYLNLKTNQLNVQMSGASKTELTADVANDAKVDVSGSSNMLLDLKATNVKFSSSGVCSVDLNGSASDIKIDVSGSSNIKAANFTVNSATVESSGTSNVALAVTKSLKVSSSGASTVSYKGSPTIDVNTSGASKIKSL